MNITPDMIIGNLDKKCSCLDCKYSRTIYGRNWQWCENPKRPTHAITKKELNHDSHCPVFVYSPTLGRRIKKWLRAHNAWLYWKWADKDGELDR